MPTSAERADHAVHAVGGHLAAAGWTPVPLRSGLPDRPVIALRTARFRWRWMATRLHTVAVTLPLRGGEDEAWLDAMLAAVVEDARGALQGVPLGLQSGIAVIVTVVGSDLPPSLDTWASRPHGGDFAVIVHPTLVDLADGRVVEPPKRRLGAIYHSYLRGLVATHVAPFASPDTPVDAPPA